MARKVLLGLVLVLSGLPSAPTAQSGSYMVVAVGDMSGGPSGASGVNDANDVVGWYSSGTPPMTRAFLYRNGVTTATETLAGGETMTGLPSLAGDWMAANGINTAGTIVGQGAISTGRSRAFMYANGVTTDLGTLAGDTDSDAYGVNDAGVVVGYSQQYSPAGRVVSAVQWSNGTIARLGNLPGSTWASARAVNAGRVVVGTAKDAGGVDRAVRWSGGTIVDLNTEIPAGSGWQLQSASAINDAGAIVGTGVFNGITRGFLLIPSADMASQEDVR